MAAPDRQRSRRAQLSPWSRQPRRWFDRNGKTTRNYAEISALDEAMGTQLIEERDDPRRVASNLGQKAETVGAVSLLPSRRQRPGRRPAEQRDELAPLDLCTHSITSSARASSVGGTSRPSIRAVDALMTSSNFDDCTTG